MNSEGCCVPNMEIQIIFLFSFLHLCPCVYNKIKSNAYYIKLYFLRQVDNSWGQVLFMEIIRKCDQDPIF